MRNVNSAQKRGSVLIVLIIAMVIAGTLGASMYLLTSTSTFGSLVSNRANRALLLAESGIRYDQKASLADGTVTVTLNSSADQFIIVKSTDAGTGVKTTVSTGIADANSPWPVRRKMTYVSGTPGSSGPPQTLGSPDRMENLGMNWLLSGDLVHGVVTRQSVGGDNAMRVTGTSGSDHVVIPLAGGAGTLNELLKNLWTYNGGLSYDAQVKVRIDSTSSPNAAAGMYIRRHGVSGHNESFGISFVRLHNRTNSGLNRYDRGSSPYKLTLDRVYVILWKDIAGGPDGFRTIAYYRTPWTTLPEWATILVRVRETSTPTAASSGGSSFTGGTRVNEIQVYYSTNDDSGTGDAIPTNNAPNRKGNLRSGAVNWPPPSGGTIASNDRFTLINWNTAYTSSTANGWPSGYGGWNSNYRFAATADGTYTIIQTTENVTNIAAYGNASGPSASFPPEMALAALGADIENDVYFDDFAIGSGPFNGGGSQSSGYYTY